MARSDLRAATGVIHQVDGSSEREIPTFTCPHCNAVGVVGGDDGGWCFKCGRLLCRSERCLEDCRPFLATVERSLG
jgi:hypothetical protein